MHDEDDPKDKGKILYSGITPEDSAEVADYALPPGEAAYVGGDLERVPVRWTRRRFLGVALGITGTAFVSYSLGSAVAGDAPPVVLSRGQRLSRRDLKRIDAAKTWAHAPMANLREAAVPFLWVFHVIEPDSNLLVGLRRLCDYALLDRGESGHELALLLLDTFRQAPAPSVFESYREKLQESVWKWQLGRQRKR